MHTRPLGAKIIPCLQVGWACSCTGWQGVGTMYVLGVCLVSPRNVTFESAVQDHPSRLHTLKVAYERSNTTPLGGLNVLPYNVLRRC
jgi:hypothetical protein